MRLTYCSAIVGGLLLPSTLFSASLQYTGRLANLLWSEGVYKTTGTSAPGMYLHMASYSWTNPTGGAITKVAFDVNTGALNERTISMHLGVDASATGVTTQPNSGVGITAQAVDSVHFDLSQESDFTIESTYQGSVTLSPNGYSGAEKANYGVSSRIRLIPTQAYPNPDTKFAVDGVGLTSDHFLPKTIGSHRITGVLPAGSYVVSASFGTISPLLGLTAGITEAGGVGRTRPTDGRRRPEPTRVVDRVRPTALGLRGWGLAAYRRKAAGGGRFDWFTA